MIHGALVQSNMGKLHTTVRCTFWLLQKKKEKKKWVMLNRIAIKIVFFLFLKKIITGTELHTVS